MSCTSLATGRNSAEPYGFVTGCLVCMTRLCLREVLSQCSIREESGIPWKGSKLHLAARNSSYEQSSESLIDDATIMSRDS